MKLRTKEHNQKISDAVRRDRQENPEVYQRAAEKQRQRVETIKGTVHKECNKCEQMKPLEAFQKDKHAKNGVGRTYSCKACIKAKRENLVTYDKIVNLQQLGDKCSVCQFVHRPKLNTAAFVIKQNKAYCANCALSS